MQPATEVVKRRKMRMFLLSGNFTSRLARIALDWPYPNLECAGTTALWNWQTCLPVGKRRHVAALQTKALPPGLSHLPDRYCRGGRQNRIEISRRGISLEESSGSGHQKIEERNASLRLKSTTARRQQQQGQK